MAYDATISNKLRLDLLKISAGLVAHVSSASAVGTANATDDATAATLAASLISAFNTHCADVCNATSGAGAHRAADTATIGTLLDTNVKAEAIRNALHAHFGRDTIHFAADDVADALLHAPTKGGIDEICASLNASKAALNSRLANALNSPVAS